MQRAGSGVRHVPPTQRAGAMHDGPAAGPHAFPSDALGIHVGGAPSSAPHVPFRQIAPAPQVAPASAVA
jgi:hypothetical protein